MKTFRIIIFLILCLRCNNALAQETDRLPDGKVDDTSSNIRFSTPESRLFEAKVSKAHDMSNQAYILMDQGKYSQAEKLFKTCLGILQQDHDAHATLAGLAELNARQHLLPEAIQYYEMLYRSDPNVCSSIKSEPVPMMQYALVLARNGQWEQAVEKYERSLILFARIGSVNQKKMKIDPALLRRKGDGSNPDWEFTITPEEISRYLPDEWNVHFRADHEQYDSLMAMAHLMVGSVQPTYRRNSNVENGKHLRQAVSLRPSNASIQYEYGRWLDDNNKPEQALAAFRQASKLAAPDSEMYRASKQNKTHLQSLLITLQQKKELRLKDGKP